MTLPPFRPPLQKSLINSLRHISLIIALMVAVLAYPVTATQAFESPAKAGAGQHLKTIIVNNYHPYTFLNDKGEPDGFSVDIAKAVTTAMDLELEIRPDKWDLAMKELETGSIDLLPMMAYSPERDKIFDFSVPHTIAYDAIFIKKGTTSLRTLKDLSGKTVIVMNKDAAHSYLLSSGLSKTMNLNLVESLPDALKQLAAGKGDAAIMPKLVGIVTAKKLNLSNIETSPQLIDAYTRPFSFAVKEGNQALLERLNQGLNIIKSTGQYDAIYKKWFGALEDPHIHWRVAIKYALIALSILFAFLVWNVMLKRQVQAKTEGLHAEIVKRKELEASLLAANDTLQEQYEELQLNEESLRDQNDQLLAVEEMLRQQIRESEANLKLLKVSEERHRVILQTAMDGIWLADIQGNILEVNEAYCRMSGYSQQELLGMNIFDLEVNNTDTDKSHRIQKIKEQGEARFDSQHRRKDGAIISVDICVKYRSEDGGQSIAFIRDITDRRKTEEEKLILEQQFHQAQKHESLGVLSGGIAHDFNNILAIIMGYCSLAKMNYDEAENYIPEIEKAAERAAGLCRQMLAYAGKAQLTKTQVDMSILVHEMVNMLQSTLPQNAVIKPHISDDLPFVIGDTSQISQVAMNLIINASEAIGNVQGEIRVSLMDAMIVAAHMEKDYHGKAIPQGRYICLEVADTGCGMDDETKSRIFEPFFTTKFTGRGLGMSAVLGIITAHHGSLQLFSEPGKGTTFKVYLPAERRKKVRDEALRQVASVPWQGSGTILLVEDEDQIRNNAKTLLQIFGFTVVEAVNGKEALELYQKHLTDITLVLTDMGMPVMDGYTLFVELKKLNPELPVIISSGFGEEDIATKIPRKEIAGLISKPYNHAQLREVLKRTLKSG